MKSPGRLLLRIRGGRPSGTGRGLSRCRDRFDFAVMVRSRTCGGLHHNGSAQSLSAPVRAVDGRARVMRASAPFRVEFSGADDADAVGFPVGLQLRHALIITAQLM